MTTMTKKRGKRTYYPSKTFDDDLDAFVELAKREGWHFSGIDLEQIARDSVEQRDERGEYVAAEARFNDLHEHFGLAQEARYQRFAAALNAARGAFRGNETIMMQLESFRRVARRMAGPPATPAHEVREGRAFHDDA